MVPTIAFSGLESSIWALASAVAMAAMLSLDRCMGSLHLDQVKADGARFRAFCPDAVAHRLLGILGHQPPEFAFGPLMVGMGVLGLTKQPGKLGPGIGGVHVDHPDRLDPGFWRFAFEQRGGFAGLD